MNKHLIFFMAMAVLFAAAVALTAIDSALADEILPFLQGFEYFGLMIMLRNGTFIFTGNFIITVAFLGVLLIAVVMMIMKLPAGEDLTWVVFGGIFIAYSIHFLRKKSKTLLDILKFITFALFLPFPLFFFRPISSETKEIVMLLGHVFFGITFGLYYLMRERSVERSAGRV